MTASSIMMLKAEAQGNLLGDDYRRWDRTGCDLDGWTPFGQIRVAIDRRAKKYASKVHSQTIPKSSIQEKITKCKFHLSNKESAIAKHEEGKLIPKNPDVAVWTDGSLMREPGEEPISKTAAIIHMSDPDHHSSIFDLDINVTLRLENVVSSYETEMIALQAGLDSLASMNPSDRKIHVFTDSLSC